MLCGGGCGGGSGVAGAVGDEVSYLLLCSVIVNCDFFYF